MMYIDCVIKRTGNEGTQSSSSLLCSVWLPPKTCLVQVEKAEQCMLSEVFVVVLLLFFFKFGNSNSGSKKGNGEARL